MIRKLQITDTKQVMELWLRGNISAHPFISTEYWKSNLASVREELLQAEVYVLEQMGSILGFIGLQEDYIAGIFVKEDYRSAGIGKKLLDHVKASHPALTLNVYQKNRRAWEFYRREGFEMISQETESGSGELEETLRWYRRDEGVTNEQTV